MGEEGVHGGWSLLRKRMRFVVGTKGEGVGAVVSHFSLCELIGAYRSVGE